MDVLNALIIFLEASDRVEIWFYVGGWCSRPVNGPYGIGLWKFISQGWSSFSSHILFDIGDGSRVKFWQDRWCGESSLAVRYPTLFRFVGTRRLAWLSLCCSPMVSSFGM